MKYKVIFVNWTKPYFYKHEAEGYNKSKLADLKSEQYDMVDYELLIQKVAIHNARKFLKVPIKLYTDDVGYQFYEKNNMIELFDEIDVDTLNNFNDNTLNAGKWWTSGKSIAIGNEEPPFLFLDNDFIVESELPKSFFDFDLVHTHWEIQRGKFFVTNEMIQKYKVPITNFNEEMLMPNTSFVFMNNKELQRYYYVNHLNIVLTQYKDIPEWLWLLSDQGILGYCARELDCKVGTLEDKAYLAYSEKQKGISSKSCGYSPMWVDIDGIESNTDFKYWHIWQDKFTMRKDSKFREFIVDKLNRIITKPTLL